MRWLVLLGFAVACRVDVTEDVDAVTAAVAPVEPATVEPPDDTCARLPTSGPCALACDLERLIEIYVPDGACLTLACDLVGGGTLTVHACGTAP